MNLTNANLLPTVLYAIGILTFILFLSISVVVIVAGNKIFSGSGDPKTMISKLIGIFNLYLQAFIAVLIIGTLLILMIEKLITANEGLPIFTLIAGFIVGNSSKKEERTKAE